MIRKNPYLIAIGVVLLTSWLVNKITNINTPSSPTSSDPEGTINSTPDWPAIAAWPKIEWSNPEATPDPKRQITVIVFDDSGSMEQDIVVAKMAVKRAVDAMKPTDRIAVIALNRGIVQKFDTVADAQTTLPGLLQPVQARGGTPLSGSVESARRLLELEAAKARGDG